MTIFVTQGAQRASRAIFGQANAAILNQLLQAVPAERRQAFVDAYLRDGTDSNNNDPTGKCGCSSKLSSQSIWMFDGARPVCNDREPISISTDARSIAG